LHRSDSLDLVFDKPSELFRVRDSHPQNVTVVARYSVELFDLGHASEYRRGPGVAKLSLNENEGYEAFRHSSPLM
jgi:hypothetical protein